MRAFKKWIRIGFGVGGGSRGGRHPQVFQKLSLYLSLIANPKIAV